jgi:hypothetical protein
MSGPAPPVVFNSIHLGTRLSPTSSDSFDELVMDSPYSSEVVIE